MSLHFTLAKKMLAHAKDLIRHIFNEHGHDFDDAQKKFLDAVKQEAIAELKSIEQKAESKIGDQLQHWQRGPRPEDASSVHAPAALPEEDTPVEHPTEEKTDENTASPEPSENGASKSDGQAKSPGDDVQTFPHGDTEHFGDADAQTTPEPDRVPPVKPVESDGTAAEFHGEPLPSSAIESQAAADKPATEKPVEKEDEPEPKPSEPSQSFPSESTPSESAPSESAASAPTLGGAPEGTAEAAKEEQESTPMAKGELEGQKIEDKAANS